MNSIDFESNVKALKVSFIKRILDDNPDKWKKLANHFCNAQDLDFYFQCNRIIVYQFYAEVHNYWFEPQRVKEIDLHLVSNQVIWNNRYITIWNKPFRWRNWAGCICTWGIRWKWGISQPHWNYEKIQHQMSLPEHTAAPPKYTTRVAQVHSKVCDNEQCQSTFCLWWR